MSHVISVVTCHPTPTPDNRTALLNLCGEFIYFHSASHTTGWRFGDSYSRNKLRNSPTPPPGLTHRGSQSLYLDAQGHAQLVPVTSQPSPPLSPLPLACSAPATWTSSMFPKTPARVMPQDLCTGCSLFLGNAFLCV
jgi:hypothetical protein